MVRPMPDPALSRSLLPLALKLADAARAAILPYAIVYSAFDALAGIAIGLLVREANGMAPAGRQAIQSFRHRAIRDLPRLVNILAFQHLGQH